MQSCSWIKETILWLCVTLPRRKNSLLSVDVDDDDDDNCGCDERISWVEYRFIGLFIGMTYRRRIVNPFSSMPGTITTLLVTMDFVQYSIYEKLSCCSWPSYNNVILPIGSSIRDESFVHTSICDESLVPTTMSRCLQCLHWPPSLLNRS